MMEPMRPPRDPGGEALRRLVDEYRSRCLWFLGPDYYPGTTEEALRVLDSIQRHGDLIAFRRAGEIRQWVLAPFSGTSANA
jgi:hypothetical protein